jgi:hypothetical protein
MEDHEKSLHRDEYQGVVPSMSTSSDKLEIGGHPLFQHVFNIEQSYLSDFKRQIQNIHKFLSRKPFSRINHKHSMLYDV